MMLYDDICDLRSLRNFETQLGETKTAQFTLGVSGRPQVATGVRLLFSGCVPTLMIPVLHGITGNHNHICHPGRIREGSECSRSTNLGSLLRATVMGDEVKSQVCRRVQSSPSSASHAKTVIVGPGF